MATVSEVVVNKKPRYQRKTKTDDLRPAGRGEFPPVFPPSKRILRGKASVQPREI